MLRDARCRCVVLKVRPGISLLIADCAAFALNALDMRIMTIVVRAVVVMRSARRIVLFNETCRLDAPIIFGINRL